MKNRKILKKILKTIIAIVAVAVLAVVILFGILTIFEYKPDDVEVVEVESAQESKSVSVNDTIKAVTWNVGYGALGDTTDYFLDGGTGVNTATEQEVKDNLAAVSDKLNELDPDIIMIQETDIKSKRSHKIDEAQLIYNNIGKEKYSRTFACNYKVLYVPYPMPTIGQVNCGISTFSKYAINSSERISLPCPFTYPTRICNLKRCLNVNRIDLEDSDKELVVINLHLEAYDSGEGKAAQTALLKKVIEDEIEKGNYVIAGGDFNQSFSNTDLSKYPKISDEVWMPGQVDESEFSGVQFVADESSPTCRSLDKPYADADKNNFQYYMLDGFIVSDNITVQSVETKNLEFKNTDHNPVIMEFTLNP